MVEEVRPVGVGEGLDCALGPVGAGVLGGLSSPKRLEKRWEDARGARVWRARAGCCGLVGSESETAHAGAEGCDMLPAGKSRDGLWECA